MIVLVVGFTVLVTGALGTLAGYGIHWVMHRRWSRPLYRAHMEHHLVHYPAGDLYSTGKYRGSGLSTGWLTFTPFAALLGGLVLGGLDALRAGSIVRWTVVAVIVLFGLLHGVVHDAFHVSDHRLGRFGWFQRLRLLHEPHHTDMKKNLGILWFGWDRLFRTFDRG